MSETRRPTSPAAEEILGGYFPVLDHGFVALVDYMGGDEAVERAARVSYGHGTRKVSRTRGLLRYLRRHLHTTPSEMVEFKFHCAMPIFVARQWIRHRTASVNEYSGRYSLMPLVFYEPQGDHFALQSATNRQGRAAQAALPGLETKDRAAQTALPGLEEAGVRPSSELYEEAVRRWGETRDQASADYRWLVGEDVARELARIDLPLSTYTQWYWKIDLHNLLHFLTLRVDPHAQWEIQEYGRVMAAMVRRVAPLSYEAWIDYQVAGERLSRGEMAALSKLVAVEEDGIAARTLLGAPEDSAVSGEARGKDSAASEETRGEAEAGVREHGGGRAFLSDDDLAELDLSPREVRELKAKLRPGPVPNFELDLGAMRSAEEMEAEMLRAAGADRARTEPI